jgi:chemotaxis protein methyltransferase CheR
MKDIDCADFLQWSLPRLGYRWRGFRKVRRQVCRRIDRRIRELGLPTLEAYRAHLASDRDEWETLDTLCRITISRFYRDRLVFDRLRTHLLAEIAQSALDQGRTSVEVWCAGCASGEEAYTLQILWRLVVAPSLSSNIAWRLVATDVDSHMLERARSGIYSLSSLKDLPEGLASEAFEPVPGGWSLRHRFRGDIEWNAQDIRKNRPVGSFDLVLCRNLAFTYFDEDVQEDVIGRIYDTTRANGLLVIGSHERLPGSAEALFAELQPCVYRKLP